MQVNQVYMRFSSGFNIKSKTDTEDMLKCLHSKRNLSNMQICADCAQPLPELNEQLNDCRVIKLNLGKINTNFSSL